MLNVGGKHMGFGPLIESLHFTNQTFLGGGGKKKKICSENIFQPVNGWLCQPIWKKSVRQKIISSTN